MIDCTLTQKITKFGIAASDYYDSLTMFDAPSTIRQDYTARCREDMEARLADVLEYVNANYGRKFNGT